jgi:Uma2 family endonuclease
MVAQIQSLAPPPPISPPPPRDRASIEYPSTDGEPLAETFLHLYAIFCILEVLLQYLKGQKATVLSNQFLYYSEGFPNLRAAPDVMVIFNVEPGPRDNYKIWEEGQPPAVVFEVTSPSTKRNDLREKKVLYHQLGVQEYWLFDPKGEWIKGQLRGYRFAEEGYVDIPADQAISQVLGLRLVVEGALLLFERVDTGDRLLTPQELQAKLAEVQKQVEEIAQRAEAETQRAEAAEAKAEALAAKLRALGIDPTV